MSDNLKVVYASQQYVKDAINNIPNNYSEILEESKSYTDTKVAELNNLASHANNTSIHFTQEERDKLSSIESGANNYSLPTASNSVLGGVKTSSNITSETGLTPCPIINGVPYYKEYTNSNDVNKYIDLELNTHHTLTQDGFITIEGLITSEQYSAVWLKVNGMRVFLAQQEEADGKAQRFVFSFKVTSGDIVNANATLNGSFKFFPLS